MIPTPTSGPPARRTVIITLSLAAVFGLGVGIIMDCAPACRNYKIVGINRSVDGPHIITILRSLQGKYYVVLSELDSNMQHLTRMTGFEEMQVGSTYNLTLERYQNPPIIEAPIRRHPYMHKLLLEAPDQDSGQSEVVFIWANGRIESKVYHCREIRGKYVKVKR